MAKSAKPVVVNKFLATNPSIWDPTEQVDNGPLTVTASRRIKRDLMSLFSEPPPGLFAVGEDNNLRCIHAIIVGVLDTPYEGGFFYFYLKCPNDYPIHPPKVKLMTTDAGRVRFNPNIYRSGKVCLSILGTWDGPAWSPSQQLSSLLISIQSLMNEKPYFNEPGYSYEHVPGDAKRYNQYIQYQTLRVAVCGVLENTCRLNIPDPLKDIMEKTFLQFYDQYVDIATKNSTLDGSRLCDIFTTESEICNYKEVLVKLHVLHDRITRKQRPLLLKTPEQTSSTMAKKGD